MSKKPSSTDWDFDIFNRFCVVQRNLVITIAFVPQDSVVKTNLPLQGIPTCTSMTNDKKLFSLHLLQDTYVVDIC